ncbi:MAG: porin family protein [Thermoanaerobaculia bacterium]
MSIRRGIETAVLSVAAVLLAAGGLAACETSIGIKGGVDWTKASFSSDVPGFRAEGSAREGFEGGLAFDGQCADHFGVSLEALYVRRDTKFFFPPSGGLAPITAVYKIEWIDFPVTGIVLFGEDGSAVRPFIFAGPVFSTRIGASSENTSEGVTKEFDANGQVKKTMFSLTAGGGARFRLGRRTWFTLDGRYVYGLTNIARGSGDRWKTRDVQVMAGFLFGLF